MFFCFSCVAEVRTVFPNEPVIAIRGYIRQKLCNAVKILRKRNEKDTCHS